MSKLMTSSAKLSLALVQDAFGNAYAGDQERSLRNLQLASQSLKLHSELLQDRNNPQVEKRVREFHAGIDAALDAFPSLDMSRAVESRARWEAAGIESSSVLPPMNREVLKSLLPGGMKPGANVVRLEGEDVKRFIQAAAGS